MNKFIYTNHSLSKEICNSIILEYEKNENKMKGETVSGVNINVKDTTDFCIPINQDIHSFWHKINNILSQELFKHLHNYFDILKMKSSSYLFEDTYLIQKYDANKGKYIYHIDINYDFTNNKYRLITFIWYLNDVSEGGETEFFGNYKIKPKQGNILFFPAGWLYPHCGKMPISNDKYIITGWLYTNIIPYQNNLNMLK